MTLLRLNHFTQCLKRYLEKGVWQGIGAVASIIAIFVSIYVWLVEAPKEPINLSSDGNWITTCPGGVALPSEIDPKNLPRQIHQQMVEPRQIDFTTLLPIADRGELRYTVINSTNGTDYAILQTTALVSITVANVPEHINFASWGGCGAGAVFKRFEPINLTSAVKSYKATTIYREEKIDYFEIKPGEPIVFVFRFVCRDPGIYTLKANIYRGLGSSSSLMDLGPSTTVVCPKKFTEWSAYFSYSNTGWLARTGIITEDSVRLRRTPSLSDGSILKELSRNTWIVFTNQNVFADNINWTKVYVPFENIEGWVSNQYLESVIDRSTQ